MRRPALAPLPAAPARPTGPNLSPVNLRVPVFYGARGSSAARENCRRQLKTRKLPVRVCGAPAPLLTRKLGVSPNNYKKSESELKWGPEAARFVPTASRTANERNRPAYVGARILTLAKHEGRFRA
ncbi:hypothetical protein EVAR_4776_1 [Eumeta japonica]|uniref:Uncharacterized protein n=1 Tax=Eumeta variegata TaxID=151549 RepID=A0A4C1SZP5_EUMVA|nr:hypothetical protein EVAR_4776_1 [Eumeta japonica]